jgi:hypothetical protein
MPSGLKCFDSNGNVTLDTTTWSGIILGSFTLPTGHGPGSYSNDALLEGRPWVAVYSVDGNIGATANGNPTNTSASVSGNTVSWTAGNPACYILFGIY